MKYYAVFSLNIHFKNIKHYSKQNEYEKLKVQKISETFPN